MKILFASSEAVPFCKTGGLGDVVGALSEALYRKKHDVRLVLPKYRDMDTRTAALKRLPIEFAVPVGNDAVPVTVWSASFGPGVTAYFIDSPLHFDRPGFYRGTDGADFPDNDRRFIVYGRAVLALAKALDFSPDVIHAHDWQAGLIPAYLKTLYWEDPFFSRTATVFSIHNIAYQGLFPKSTLAVAGWGWDQFTPDRLEYFDQVNFLKAGLVYADMISTVSPTYVREVQSGNEFGRGMEGVLRARAKDFVGILNGIDTALWNPAKDSLIARPFDARRWSARALCKADLQRAAGLDPSPTAPLLGMVSRLDPQKGFDLLLELMEGFLNQGVQAVFLGQGNAVYEAALKTLARKFRGRTAVFTNFNEALAHKIYAGSDIFLMPSRFEPCGLGQMISLRYGAVPVVTPTGGLKDTVVPLSEDGSTGVGFVSAAVSAGPFREALERAVRLYRSDPSLWKKIVRRGMALRFDWKTAVPQYVALYRRAVSRRKEQILPKK